MLGFNKKNLGAESRERLRQLAADRSGADDSETFGQLRQRENGLVGQVIDLLQSKYGRRRGTRPGCDDGLGKVKRRAGNLDGGRACKFSFTQEYVHSETLKAASGIVWTDF